MKPDIRHSHSEERTRPPIPAGEPEALRLAARSAEDPSASAAPLASAVLSASTAPLASAALSASTAPAPSTAPVASTASAASSASSERKRMRIVISGYYGYGNCGDEAVLNCILTSLKEEAARCGFTIEPIVLSIDPPATEALHGVRAVHRFDPIEIVRCLRESDALVSGGGTLKQDLEPLRTAR